MPVENKFPGKDVTAEDLQTKIPLAAKRDLITRRSLASRGWNSEGH